MKTHAVSIDKQKPTTTTTPTTGKARLRSVIISKIENDAAAASVSQLPTHDTSQNQRTILEPSMHISRCSLRSLTASSIHGFKRDVQLCLTREKRQREAQRVELADHVGDDSVLLPEALLQ